MVNDIFLLKHTLHVQGAVVSISQHYRQKTGSATGYLAKDLGDAQTTANNTSLLNCLASEVVLMKTDVFQFQPTHGTPYHIQYRDTAVGTIAGESLSPEVALPILLEVDSPNAKNNSHVFLVGMPEVEWASGVWNPAYIAGAVTAFASGLTAVITGGSGNTYEPGVLSRFDGGAKRVPPVFFPLHDYHLVGSKLSRRKHRRAEISTVH